MITADMLDRRWPRAPHSLVDAIVAFAPTVLAKFEITTPLRLAHFLAQASVECAGGTALEENLNYSAERLHAVWPARFPSIGSAQPYAHNPRLLADKVYDGRMGNRAGTDDGWNYRGRGLRELHCLTLSNYILFYLTFVIYPNIYPNGMRRVARQ